MVTPAALMPAAYVAFARLRWQTARVNTFRWSVWALLLAAGCARPLPGVGLPGGDPRVQRVETGLRTPVVVKGAASTMTIADRMRFHHVPGMSVAVVDQGRIAWARGYGVTEA